MFYLFLCATNTQVARFQNIVLKSLNSWSLVWVLPLALKGNYQVQLLLFVIFFIIFLQYIQCKIQICIQKVQKALVPKVKLHLNFLVQYFKTLDYSVCPVICPFILAQLEHLYRVKIQVNLQLGKPNNQSILRFISLVEMTIAGGILTFFCCFSQAGSRSPSLSHSSSGSIYPSPYCSFKSPFIITSAASCYQLIKFDRKKKKKISA